MSSTNKTTYYELPQFEDNDIFNPLVDDNDAYDKIDTALHNIANAEADDASEIVGIKSRLDGAEGDIDALEAQNGTEVLTTTAQTLSSAVNELDADVSALDGRLDIVEDDINNVSTGLKAKVTALETQNGTEVLTTTAHTLSGAINELDADFKQHNTYVTPEQFGAVGDGVTDDTVAIQNAVNAGFCLLFEKKYRITDTIYVKTDTSCLRGMSSKSQLFADFSEEKPAVHFYGDANGGQLTRKNSSSKHGNFSIIGAVNTYTADGIMVGGDESTEYEGDVSCNIFEHITLDWLNKGVIITRKVYNNLFIGINSNTTRYGLYCNDSYGTGEVTTFLNCSFWSGANLIDLIWASFIGCTFHVLEGKQQLMESQYSDICIKSPCRFTDCHFERLTWADDADTNYGNGIYVDAEVMFTNCEFVLDTHAHKANSLIKVNAQSYGNYEIKRVILNNCDVQWAIRGNTDYIDACFNGNIDFVNCATKGNAQATNILETQKFSSNPIALTPTNGTIEDLTEHVTTNDVDNLDGSYTIEATADEYVGSLNYRMTWELPTFGKSSVLMQFLTAVSAGQTYFNYDTSNSANSLTVRYYDAVGNAISPVNINDSMTKSVNSNTLSALQSRFFQLPPNCAKVKIGWWVNAGATSQGATKTMTFKASAVLI